MTPDLNVENALDLQILFSKPMFAEKWLDWVSLHEINDFFRDDLTHIFLNEVSGFLISLVWLSHCTRDVGRQTDLILFFPHILVVFPRQE